MDKGASNERGSVGGKVMVRVTIILTKCVTKIKTPARTCNCSGFVIYIARLCRDGIMDGGILNKCDPHFAPVCDA